MKGRGGGREQGRERIRIGGREGQSPATQHVLTLSYFRSTFPYSFPRFLTRKKIALEICNQFGLFLKLGKSSFCKSRLPKGGGKVSC